jgi:Golgi phosphoprotein 3 (GPP34)
MATEDLTLPEELFLLSVEPVTGKPRRRSRILRFGVAAAVLAALESAGRVAEDGHGHVSVVNPQPTGDPPADRALALLVDGGKAVRATRWIAGRPASRVLDACVQDLVGRGVLTVGRHRVLGIIPTRRYLPAGTDRSASVLADFQAAAKMDFPEPRDRMLAALADAMKLGRSLLPGGGTAKRARSTMRTLSREHWAPRAVAKAVLADNAAKGAA